MPLYQYECDKNKKGCSHVWEEQLLVEDRVRPMTEPCPKCSKVDTIIRLINFKNIKASTKSYTQGLSTKNMDPVVRERLESIKNGGFTNNETSKIQWGD
jgi:hypothetical protein